MSEIECWRKNMQPLMEKNRINQNKTPDIKTESGPDVEYIVLSSDEESSKPKNNKNSNPRLVRTSQRNINKQKYHASKQPNYNLFCKVK